MGIHFDVGGRYSQGPTSAILAEFASAQMNGSFRFVIERSAHLDGDVSALIPVDLVILRHLELDGGGQIVLAGGFESLLMVKHYGKEANVSVAASSLARAHEVVDKALSGVPAPPSDGKTVLSIWHTGQFGPKSRKVRIDAPAWSEISRNYPPGVRAAVDGLSALHEPGDGGRLILWHGAPGTGKTTAIRALAREWAGWCRPSVIADPERLFADSDYLHNVVTEPPRSHTGKPDPGWQIVVAEDSDEFLRTSARREAGAALGRLLNVADGILGQGTRTLLLLTTNERIDRLHPALTRPGRCLATIDFTAFDVDEAAQWLPDGIVPPAAPSTLADLYELSGANSPITNAVTSSESFGTYL